MDAFATKSRLALVLLTLAATVAVACTGPGSVASTSSTGVASTTPTAARLTVELDWIPNPDHVGIYYAQSKGFFTEQNLSVSLRVPSKVSDPMTMIGLSKVDLAISYEPEVFYAQQNSLPVVAVATVVPVPLNSLIVTPGVAAPDLAAMRGKKIGVTGIPSDDAFLQTMLKTAGLTSSEITKVNVGFNLTTSILSNQVDAILGGYQNVEAIQIEQETGQKPTVFPANELGVPTYAELVLVANADRLASDPAYASAVTRFVAALVKGTNTAIADPAGATQVMASATQYDATFLASSIPYTLKLLTPVAGTKTGCLSSAAWQSYADWMKTSGLLTDSPDAAAVTSNRYLPYSCT